MKKIIFTLFLVFGLLAFLPANAAEVTLQLSLSELQALFGGREAAPSSEMLGGTSHFDTLAADDIYLNGTDGYLNFSTTQGSTGYGIRNNSGTMQYKDSGGSWGSLGGGTPGDEGWLANSANDGIYPTTNEYGNRYVIISGATATSSPATGSTDLFSATAADFAGTLSVAGNVDFDGGTFVYNESSADKDARWESNGDAYMIFLDAGNDGVAIGSSTASTYTLTVDGNVGINDYIYHNDSSDDFLGWDGDDLFVLKVGNEEMIDITEDGSQDIIELGDGGDIDIDLNDDVMILGSNSSVGIGVTDPDTILEVYKAGTQVKLSYDGSNYVTLAVGAAGDLTIDSNKTNFGSDFGDSNMTTTGTLAADNTTINGSFTANEGSENVDFRVETNNQTHMLFIEGGTDMVSIGTSTTEAIGIFHVGSSTPGDATAYNDSFMSGALEVDGALYVDGALDFDGGAFTFNESSADLDARFESDDDDYMLFINGGDDKVAIGSSTATYTLSVDGTVGINDYIYHNDSSDDLLGWDGDDLFVLKVGNEEILDITEDGSQDIIEIGDAGDFDIYLAGGASDAVFVEGSSANVGIGTTSLTYTLEVDGTIGMNTYLYHNDSADDYLGWDEDDAFTLKVGNEEMLDITENDTQDIFEIGDGGDIDVDLNDDMFIEGSSSKVGIGTTTPSGDLDIYSAATTTISITTDASAGTCFEIHATDGTLSYCMLPEGGTALLCSSTSCK